MSQSEQPPRPEADPDQLPRHTTPTWEVELLISGVAVFAMLQLPGWLDDRYFSLFPRFDTDWSEMLRLMYMYLKCAAVILAVTFAAHLSLRAHWIALVGMHSVYPDGVRREDQRVGPVQRELDRQRHDKAPAAIERADNRATIVFAIGVTLATTFLMLCMLVIWGFLMARLCILLTGTHVQTGLLMFGWMMLLIVTVVVLKLFDRFFGARLRPDGAPRRWLATMLHGYGRIGFGQRSSVMALLSTGTGTRVQQLMIFSVFAVLIAAVLFQLQTLKSPQQLGSYRFFPSAAASARRIANEHYDDQRDPLHDAAVPFVQSVVIGGPFVQLTVPYRPTRDTPALRQACAGAMHAADEAARVAATLDCLTRIHPVSLDGAPLASLHYDAGSDPRTQRPALLAMIDVRALAPGRHELRVTRAPPARDGDERDDVVQDVIPFWR